MTPIQTAYAVAEGHRLDIPASVPEPLRNIIEACWHEDQTQRPSFTYIAMALADYAKLAFNPNAVGAQTVEIANELLSSVQGNSTVNVDLSVGLVDHRRHSSLPCPPYDARAWARTCSGRRQRQRKRRAAQEEEPSHHRPSGTHRFHHTPKNVSSAT